MKKALCTLLLMGLLLALSTTFSFAEKALPPEGYLRVDEIVMTNMTTFGHVALLADTGETVIHDQWFSDWYHGIDFVTASARGMTLSIKNDKMTGGTASLLLLTFKFDGEEHVLPVGPGLLIPYEKEGNIYRFLWEEPSEAYHESIADLMSDD